MLPARNDLRFRPLTPEGWPDLERLFGPRGGCGGCWCMVWRLARSEWVRGKDGANKAALRHLVDEGRPTGFLAYAGGEPVGWCAVAPRRDYPFLERSRVLRPVDDRPVWSVSCLLVSRPRRRQGISVALLAAAADYVRERGGSVVEGYPVVPAGGAMPSAFAWTGLASAFLAAGYEEVARRSPTRPIMRKVVEPGAPAGRGNLPVTGR